MDNLVEFFKNNPLPPVRGSFDPKQEAEIKRRRRMAEMLMKQGGPKPTEVISGYAVPQSGLEQLARGLAGGIGSYQAATADNQEKELAQKRQELLAKALGSGSAKEAGAYLAQDPSMAKDAIDLAFPRQTFGSTPAALQLANEVARLEAVGDSAGAARIREFAKTQEKGTVFDNGVISNTPGYTDTVAAKEAAKAGGKVVGTNAATNQAALPAATAKANYAIQLIDQMVGNPELGIPEHQGLRGAVGFSSVVPNRPGSQAASFENRLAQIGGQQFLEAFGQLKGGGAITEIEGQKATAAIARMQASNSEEEFINAAREFQGIVKQGLARQQAQAGVQQQMPQPAPPNRADPLAAARDAIAKGAPRDAVIQRLQQNGIDATGL